MTAHGLWAAGLFILCGELYERIHTRDMRMMGGVEQDEMAASTVAVLAVATLGMPGTGNLVGEFMIIFGSFRLYR
ncbi:proton-conducting transporter membrane subunit [Escherichia coli]